MRVNVLTAGLLAVAGLLASGAASQAGDVFRLALPAGGDVPALKLGQIDTNAETLDVWRGGFGGFRGGFGGFRAGFGFGGFRGGFYGGFRGWGGGWGGWRGGWGGWGGGWGGWRGGWGGWGGGWGYSCYQPYWGCGYGWCGSPWVSLGCNNGFCSISDTSPGIASNFTLSLGPTSLRVQTPQALPAQPGTLQQPSPNGNGTFNYDGGPRSPVPLPRSDQSAPPVNPAPKSVQPSVPLEGLPISYPAPAVVRTAPKYAYPAYGERAR